MLHPEHVYHVCRRCHGRFLGHAAWGAHLVLGRPRCVMRHWIVALCTRTAYLTALAPLR